MLFKLNKLINALKCSGVDMIFKWGVGIKKKRQLNEWGKLENLIPPLKTFYQGNKKPMEGI